MRETTDLPSLTCNFAENTMRIVLDTNIVIDLLHFADRRAAPLWPWLKEGRLQCFTDRECLTELERVSGYPEFGLDAAARKALMQRYSEVAQASNALDDEPMALPRCRDADDQKFLVLAARCSAELLITRDKELLRLCRHRLPFAILTAETAVVQIDTLFQTLQTPPEDPSHRI